MGQAMYFGHQKGATFEMVKILDKNLKHFSDTVRLQLGKEIEGGRSRSSRGIRISFSRILQC